jgi:hypothetical protein
MPKGDCTAKTSASQVQHTRNTASTAKFCYMMMAGEWQCSQV